MKNKLLTLLLLLLILLFTLSIFKNISYPLLWNDEAETAMYAERILDYGYPKIHDGKNIVYLTDNPFGINKKFDAYLTSGWVQYYFGAIGAYLARFFDNFYTKTALMRIPFALIGLLGIFIFAMIPLKLFDNRTDRLLFLIFFMILELFSVPLILHLREARYYSPTIFLSACFFHIYLNYNFYNILRFRNYFFASILLLFLIFNAYYPVFFIFIVTIGIWELPSLAKSLIKRDPAAVFGRLLTISPLFFTLILIIPLLIFFRTFEISSALTGINLYVKHLLYMLEFFYKYNLLFLIVFLYILYMFFRRSANIVPPKTKAKFQFSNFLILFSIVYIFIIARSYYFFDRYFIVLEPLAAIILLLAGFSVVEIIPHLSRRMIKWAKILLWVVILAVFSLSASNNIYLFEEHLYEIFNQYKGPLDYAIPFIQNNYKNPQNLVIATNYEECAYMYYLKSKVIIGLIHNNLEEDLKESPDIIIYRKFMGNPDADLLGSFLKKEKYYKLSCSVFDSAANNNPDIRYHLFRTQITSAAAGSLDMYIKPGLFAIADKP